MGDSSTACHGRVLAMTRNPSRTQQGRGSGHRGLHDPAPPGRGEPALGSVGGGTRGRLRAAGAVALVPAPPPRALPRALRNPAVTPAGAGRALRKRLRESPPRVLEASAAGLCPRPAAAAEPRRSRPAAMAAMAAPGPARLLRAVAASSRRWLFSSTSPAAGPRPGCSSAAAAGRAARPFSLSARAVLR